MRSASRTGRPRRRGGCGCGAGCRCGETGAWVRRGGTLVVLPPDAGPPEEEDEFGKWGAGAVGDALRWARRGAKRLLAPPAAKPTIPPEFEGLIRQVQWVLSKLPPLPGAKKGRMKAPTGLRFLDPPEQGLAGSFFNGSLDLGKILISDGLGYGGAPFTVAVMSPPHWWVIMNVGDLQSRAGGDRSRLLIHELAHAWQSQHHPKKPTAFMSNSVTCQVAAPGIANYFGEEASAYAYVPGKSFGQYAAEQIAQQVEDAYTGAGRPTPRVIEHVRSLAPGAYSAENERSLTVSPVTGVHRKGEPGVVFPPLQSAKVAKPSKPRGSR